MSANIPCSYWIDVGERPVADILHGPTDFCDYPPQPEDPRCPDNGFDGDWTHIAFCLKSDNVKFYINGELRRDTENYSTFKPFNSGVGNIFIGRWVDRANQYVGAIDDLRIYTRCLSEDEINCLRLPPAVRENDPDCLQYEGLLP